MSLSATLTRRPRSAMPSRICSYSAVTALRLVLREDVLAEQRRVRVQPALVEAREHLGGLVERLAGDEAVGAQAHAVLARDAADPPAARGREDALAQRAVDALRDARRWPGRRAGRSRGNRLEQSAHGAARAHLARRRRGCAAARGRRPRWARRAARSTVLSAAGIGKRSSVMRAVAGALGRLGRALAHGRRRRARGAPRRAPRSRRSRRRASACAISDSGPQKMSSPSSRYGSKRSHGCSETLRPGEVRDALAELLDHGERDRIAAAGGEAVDVERQRRARLAPPPRDARAARGRRAGSRAAR